jgi:osmoprotectant transport system substrate-binding protein
MLKRTFLGLAAAAAMTLAGPALAQTLVVGGKNFTEQQLMAELTAQYLKKEGYTVDKRAGLGSAPLRQAQEAGQVDVYWEYTWHLADHLQQGDRKDGRGRHLRQG